MRKLLFTCLTFLLITAAAHAQAPAFINYQGVARNSVGNALVNKNITLRLSIREGGALGNITYRETRSVTTNAFGLFSVQVGGAGASNVSGSVGGTDWKVGTKWMQVEIDPEGGSNLKDVGTTQLTSVPYSLFASQSGDVVLPFLKSQGEDVPLYKLINTNNNASSLAYEGLSSSTANNATAIRGIMTSVSPGVFSAAVTGQNNGEGTNGIGVYGNQNGRGWGVYGTTPAGIGVYGNSISGIGVYGQSASGTSVMGFKDINGLGSAGLFSNNSTINFSPVLSVQSNGPGHGLNVGMTGLGNGFVLAINNSANINTVLAASGNGTGKTASFQNTNAANSSNVLEAVSNGTGRIGVFQNTNTANASNVLDASTNGTGRVGYFQNSSPANTSNVVEITTNGNGKTAMLQNTNAFNASNVLEVQTNGTGRSGLFQNSNAANSSNVLEVQTNGAGKAIVLQNTNAANVSNVLEIQTSGVGRSAFVNASNAASSANALEVNTAGTGFAASFINTNAAPKALRTTGSIQFTGISEGPFKVLSTVDGSGNATWQSAASVGLVSGSGTLNYVSKWTPDGTIINNSQIFDNGTKLSIGGAIDAYYDLGIHKTLKVRADAPDTAVAIFENTNGNTKSDGIIIKLGRTHPRWHGSSYANVPNPMTGQLTSQTNQIRDWIYGNTGFNWSQLINMIPNQAIVGSMTNITNYITQNINNVLGLPLKIGPYGTSPYTLIPYTQIFPGLSLPALPDVPSIHIGPYTIPALPVIPEVTVMPAIPQIGWGPLQAFSFPNFVFNDVSNSLSKENEYISFMDNSNRKLGAIRAQSIQNFSYDYFDGQKLLEIAGELIGIDLADDFVSLIAEVSAMAVDYNKIGVEYSSGNGDYAEWLERVNTKEEISFGDIVAVKGGKITKDINGAEQIMAVSKKPIVLGNMPDESKITRGNNIAFMGQIPVKVTGPVQSGDYIVAKGAIPGYGVAVHPKDMKVEDFKLAVGRSWDTNLKDGPKMVNTVVGVHNHDFLNIIGGLQKKADQTEERLKAIERILNVNANNSNDQPKKAFK